MDSNKIKIGLASYGLSGQVFHAPFIEQHPNFCLTHVCERTKNLSERLYSKPQILKTFEELLRSDVHVIVVNTPSYLHFDMAKRALEAGKHVVLEKPFTSSVSDAQALINLAKEKTLILAIFHNRRLESGYKTMKQVVDSNVLGDIQYYKAHFNRNKPMIGSKAWKEQSKYNASGLFYDLAPHLIDQALFMFGYPNTINCIKERQRPLSEVTDYFLITLGYSNGLKVELEASCVKDDIEPKYFIKGSLASFVKEKEDHQEWLLKQGIFPSVFDPNNSIISFDSGEQRAVKNVKGSYSDFYTNLYEVLINKSELLITPEEGLDTMHVMEACNK